MLADASLKVKRRETLSAAFETTIGTPQGDGLSPILFAIYLESAIREVRAESIPRPAADLGLPLEAIYADDTDIISTSKAYLKSLEGLIPPTIGRRKLQANASKWKRTVLVKDDQSWRKKKLLGTL